MRRATLLLIGVGSLVLAGASAMTWASAPVSAIASDEVAVTGFESVPTLVPLGLVVAAALVGRLLASGMARRVLTLIALVAALGLVLVTALGAASPADALRASAGAETGVPELSGSIATTLWGWVASAGACALSAGLAMLVTQREMAKPQPRFERPGMSEARSSVSEWDDLSEGEDPTRGDAH